MSRSAVIGPAAGSPGGSTRRPRPLALLAALVLCLGPLAAPPAAVAAPADVDPLPGQSDQPAPPSGKKRVIENVHTDTVSAFVDDGRLALDSKADVDGVLGKRFAANATLFHVSDGARREIPQNSGFRFLGPAGDPVWLAPQVQDHALIWPGFSTEDPALRAAAPGGSLAVRLVDVEGPGGVEMYLNGDERPDRVFSSAEPLPEWTIGVPQHTHMNWAFTAPGSYTLTFEMEGRISGETQRARNAYTFVVGDLAAHTAATAVVLEADATETDPGDPVTFTARVSADPATRAPVGAVQFRDAESEVILGHSPVGAGGEAAFRTGSLPIGERRIVAEFVPSWSDDFASSASQELAVVVRGEQIPRPEHDDVEPVAEEQFAGSPAGAGVRVTNAQRTVAVGGTVAAQLVGDDQRDEHRGDWVSVWVHSDPVWLGWVQTGLDGRFSVPLPDSVAAGTHRLAVKDRDGGFIGWDELTVTERQGGGGGGTPAPKPKPAPVAPRQECRPAVTLDHGHIDAFTVSAGGGRAVLQLLEDVTGHRVLREAETVLLRVKEQALTRIPAGVPGGPSGYVLPLSQNPNLIWPGWDTNRTAASGYTDVSINVTGVAGPGRVSLYTSRGSFGGWRPILSHGGYHLPGTIREPTPAHTHAQWVFSRKGVYVLTAHAVARNPGTGASLTTASHTYVFQVGDVPLGDVFCGLSPHGAGDAALVNAAVQRAGKRAVAAQQAEAADAQRERGRFVSRRVGDGGDPLAALLGGELPPAALAGVVGGGVLVLAGIAGGTVWLLRRIGASAAGDAEPPDG